MSKPISSRSSFLPRQAWLVAVNIGLLLIVIGTAIPLLRLSGFDSTGIISRIVYSVGAAAVLIGRLFAPSTAGLPLRVRRLCRLEIWTGIIFCVGACFMFYTPERMDWLAFTLAGAVIQIYTSLMIPRAMEKEQKSSSGAKK